MSTDTKSRPRTALVTGAARRIGAGIAQALHERGCRVFLHYNKSEGEALTVVDKLNAIRPNSAILVQADLTATDGPQQLAEQLRCDTDRLDVLVNNASRFYPTTVGEVTPEIWRDLMGSNVRGPFFLCQALLPELINAQGAIINILDIHAEKPMRRHTVYCMAKSALAMMTLSLARELGPQIRVNGVSPGAIMWPENEPPESVKKYILERTVMKRMGSPQDIADAVVFLGLDAPYITGQILAVDGGRSLNI
ncbi:MAG: pteridine reductase [Lysobacterales bacterium]